MKDETIIPVIRNTEHGQLYIAPHHGARKERLCNQKRRW